MGVVYVHISRHLKEELVWAIDKQFWFISSALNSYKSMEINKTVSRLRVAAGL